MKTKILAVLLLGASALAAAPRFSIGIGIGVGPRYYAPAPVYVAPPPVYAPAYAAPQYYAPQPEYVAPPAPVYAAPAYGYSWVGGFWDGYGPHRVWRPGHWEHPRGEIRYRR